MLTTSVLPAPLLACFRVEGMKDQPAPAPHNGTMSQRIIG